MVRFEPIRHDWAEALAEGDTVFAERFGIPVEAGWAGFPEALPILLDAARAGVPGEWGPQLFFDDDGALVGNGGWKGPPEHLNQAARHRGLLTQVRVAHGKAAEYQARGAVHFHALLRLDGYDPADPDRLLPPPSGITIADLDEATRWAATAISYRTPPHPGQPPGWTITWGTEIDIRAITLHGTGTVTDLAVASYLAKYSTKGTEPAGHASARITAETIDLYANPGGTHPERLIDACWRIGQHPGYVGLRRWAHMLGFGGHFLTKARRYSIRFRDLREARISYRRSQDTGPDHGPIRTADHVDEETVLVVGSFTYAGTGWKTSGDALLANTAADQARKRREAACEELADEYNRTSTGRQAA